ncbi:MAG: hypothetical protein R2875_11710 [Desulfobacterales bacterium]
MAARCSFGYLEDQGELRELLSKNPRYFYFVIYGRPVYEVNQRATDMLKQVLRQGMTEGTVYPVDVDHTAEFLFFPFILCF